MRKIFTQQFIGILGILCSLVLSITLYAYKSDQNNIEEKITIETLNRKNADTQLRYESETAMSQHEKIHSEQKENNELLIKYLDQRFDDMEKLINKR